MSWKRFEEKTTNKKRGVYVHGSSIFSLLKWLCASQFKHSTKRQCLKKSEPKWSGKSMKQKLKALSLEPSLWTNGHLPMAISSTQTSLPTKRLPGAPDSSLNTELLSPVTPDTWATLPDAFTASSASSFSWSLRVFALWKTPLFNKNH